MFVILDVTTAGEWPALFPCEATRQAQTGNPVRIPLATRSTILHQGDAAQAGGELARLRSLHPDRKFKLLGEMMELRVQ